MMKKLLISCAFCWIAVISYGQEKKAWTEEYLIEMGDFQGVAPIMEEDYVQRYYLAAQLAFNYQMNHYQFAFTKNFNKYVEVYFNPASSWIEEGDQTDMLLEMANLDYDLAELHARKFRKRIFENKNIVSSPALLQSEFEKVSNEYADYRAQVLSEIMASATIHEKLAHYRQSVNLEIYNLAEFCQACKPAKKKK